ncbi:MAG: phycobilisome rod-core linker polypeptide [Cyanobacteria bacterium J06621_11]
MTDRTNGGSPVVNPQQYHTVPTAVIEGAYQRDRYLNHSETQTLSTFLKTGLQRLEIAKQLAQHANDIVAAGGKRIFVGGNPMEYFEQPEDSIGMPGSGYFVAEDYLSAKARSNNPGGNRQASVSFLNKPPANPLTWFRGLFFSGKPSVPSSFQAINIADYGKVRMKRSMRDLGWFLRYITYAIVAGDTSIISINTRGLQGVIPQDVTLATTVALREMQWKSLSYFPAESAAAVLVKQYFDVLIEDYSVEKPSDRLRAGVSKHHQGLSLPESYEESGSLKPKWVMKDSLPDIEKDAVIKAAYRQIFERDVSELYGTELSKWVSQLKGKDGSMALFIQQLGKSRLYRQLYYEPYSISRAIELACRHFLGRGISCIEEFQQYFEKVSKQGFSALIDLLVSSQEYSDYFGTETVPYLRGLGTEAQACCNWGPQIDLFKPSAAVRKVPQFITTFASYQHPLPNQHPYGSGNDPLEIQFGAIFPQETKAPNAQPTHFSEDSRRILISSGQGKINPQKEQTAIHTRSLNALGKELGRVPGASEHTFSLPQQLSPRPGHQQDHRTSSSLAYPGKAKLTSLNSNQHSIEAVILATYRQVFGCEVLESQRHKTAETQLKAQRITIRGFVRQLAKSRAFRRAYWESLYMTKAAEIIHRRLLGRPTYGREETRKYYDISGRKGFYALVDALIDSEEYQQIFGENTVPYERYVTPRGLAMRSPKGPTAISQLRDHPPTVGEYMMRYRPSANKEASRAAQNGLSSRLVEYQTSSQLASKSTSEPTDMPEASLARSSDSAPAEQSEIAEEMDSLTAAVSVESRG